MLCLWKYNIEEHIWKCVGAPWIRMPLFLCLADMLLTQLASLWLRVPQEWFMVGFRLFTCFPMNLCSEYLFLHNISTLTRPAPQALSLYRYQISSFHSADVVEFCSLGILGIWCKLAGIHFAPSSLNGRGWTCSCVSQLFCLQWIVGHVRICPSLAFVCSFPAYQYHSCLLCLPNIGFFSVLERPWFACDAFGHWILKSWTVNRRVEQGLCNFSTDFEELCRVLKHLVSEQVVAIDCEACQVHLLHDAKGLAEWKLQKCKCTSKFVHRNWKMRSFLRHVTSGLNKRVCASCVQGADLSKGCWFLQERQPVSWSLFPRDRPIQLEHHEHGKVQVWSSGPWEVLLSMS